MPKLGIGEILLIIAVALLFFGPSKLPELGKAVGKSIREFKASVSGATGEPEEPKPNPPQTAAK